MKHRLLTLYIALAILLVPVVAFAASKDTDDEVQKFEGRFEGYSSSVRIGNGSNAMTWIVIGFLCVLTLACFFKNAKRTHLD